MPCQGQVPRQRVPETQVGPGPRSGPGPYKRGVFVGHQNIFVGAELAYRATAVDRPRVCRGQVATHRSDPAPAKMFPTLGSGARPGWRASGDGRPFPPGDPLVLAGEPLTGSRRPRGPPLRLRGPPSTNLPKECGDHGGWAVAPRKVGLRGGRAWNEMARRATPTLPAAQGSRRTPPQTPQRNVA